MQGKVRRVEQETVGRNILDMQAPLFPSKTQECDLGAYVSRIFFLADQVFT